MIPQKPGPSVQRGYIVALVMTIRHDRPQRRQATWTSICLGLAFSFFGRCTMSKPFLNLALILSALASLGSVKLRKKVPYERSMR